MERVSMSKWQEIVAEVLRLVDEREMLYLQQLAADRQHVQDMERFKRALDGKGAQEAMRAYSKANRQRTERLNLLQEKMTKLYEQLDSL